jgi:hypothetical protein
VPRILLAAVAALLLFAPAARADDVTLPTIVTNDPVITFTDSATYQCWLDGDAPVDCSGQWRPPITKDGTYHFNASKSGLTITGTLIVDRTPPSVTFTAGPDDGATVPGAVLSYAFALSDGTATCVFDGVTVSCDNLDFAAVPAGDHALTVNAVDALGNLTSVTRHVTSVAAQLIVDPRPPASRGGVLSTTASKASVHLGVATRTRRFTRLRSIALRNLPAGAAVKVSCKGASCPRKATLRSLTGRNLAPGTKIAITLPKQTLTITIRATEAPLVR